MLLSDIVHDSARKRPGHVALVVGTTTYTYAALSARVTRLAAALGQTVAPGDRVAVLADNCVEYLDLLYGAPDVGAVLTLINQRLTAAEVEHILGDAEPRVLFVGANHVERLAGLDARAHAVERVVVFGADDDAALPSEAIRYESFLEQAAIDRPGVAPTARSDADTAWLIYTSGTTGRPKGAMLTHRSIISAVLNALLEWRATRDERHLFCFPLCHVAAFIPLAYHVRQATVVMMVGFDPSRFLALIEEHRITHTGLAPTMISMVLDHPDVATVDTTSVSLIAYGGSAMSPRLLERGLARFGHVFCGTFGQTEASGNVLALDIDDHRRAANGEPHLLAAAGRCECLAAIRLVDDEMHEVPLGEVGEIVIRGDQVMKGYWRNPEATRQTIVDGWLRTGDLARIDADGFVFIVDRKKDMVVTGGENVFPREVEDVIAGLQGVREAAVIGIPDDRWGELVVAVVCPAAGAAPSEEDVIAHCRGHLAGYKVPKRVEFRESLPRNAAMKVLKRTLRAELGSAIASA